MTYRLAGANGIVSWTWQESVGPGGTAYALCELGGQYKEYDAQFTVSH
jgi:hypothetical protein